MASFRALLAVLLVIAAVSSAALAETALQTVQKNSTANHGEGRQIVANNTFNRWWPWGGWGGWGWGWGWGWGIAAFVLAIVKGSILLGGFAIWAFFRGFAKKGGGCAPIIIRESPPPIYSHHPWDRSESIADPSSPFPRTKRAADYTEDPLYWTDMITDFAFSFLGVHSQDCRKRFVCEVDVRARADPMLQMAMQLFGGDIFRKYRGENDKVAKDFGECAKIYSKCKHSGPSMSFNVITTQVDPLLDYEDVIGNGNANVPEEEVPN
ncbi:hypothetical protein pipiens_016513 [Culex pipiens pipiens]|uniref:Uncharacterized protein n=1 Tax=Culex pipiens pipiens TaxID=38569 RepID=A0ABD1CL05_CULPP